MAVLKISKYGDPALRRRAEPVGEITPEIRAIVADMIDTMYDEVGIGLAGPQVGIPLRLIVVGDEEGRGAQALVDPVITARGGEATAEEGCLSIPGVFAPVTRSVWVKVEARDADGRPVAIDARGLRARVVQPARLRDPEWPSRLAEFGADVAVVVAFGQILPPAVLRVPARGSINVHASLLPRYRGAAPIQWALIRGETVTGATTFLMDEGMDTGPILMSATTPIGSDETAGELAARLATLGAGLLVDTLARLHTLTPTPQRHEAATLAPRLRKTDGYLDFARPARELVNLVRGCNPWPGAIAKTPT